MAAAKELVSGHRWRGSVSRSDYAAYSALAGELEGKATYPRGLNNPPHEALPRLIRSHLPRLSMADRRRVARAVVRLFAGRVDADYRPRRTVEENNALESLKEALVVL